MKLRGGFQYLQRNGVCWGGRRHFDLTKRDKKKRERAGKRGAARANSSFYGSLIFV